MRLKHGVSIVAWVAAHRPLRPVLRCLEAIGGGGLVLAGAKRFFRRLFWVNGVAACVAAGNGSCGHGHSSGAGVPLASGFDYAQFRHDQVKGLVGRLERQILGFLGAESKADGQGFSPGA